MSEFDRIGDDVSVREQVSEKYGFSDWFVSFVPKYKLDKNLFVEVVGCRVVSIDFDNDGRVGVNAHNRLGCVEIEFNESQGEFEFILFEDRVVLFEDIEDRINQYIFSVSSDDSEIHINNLAYDLRQKLYSLEHCCLDNSEQWKVVKEHIDNVLSLGLAEEVFGELSRQIEY